MIMSRLHKLNSKLSKHLKEKPRKEIIMGHLVVVELKVVQTVIINLRVKGLLYQQKQMEYKCT
jgi:hypothetical protein